MLKSKLRKRLGGLKLCQLLKLLIMFMAAFCPINESCPAELVWQARCIERVMFIIHEHLGFPKFLAKRMPKCRPETISSGHMKVDLQDTDDHGSPRPPFLYHLQIAITSCKRMVFNSLFYSSDFYSPRLTATQGYRSQSTLLFNSELRGVMAWIHVFSKAIKTKMNATALSGIWTYIADCISTLMTVALPRYSLLISNDLIKNN